MTDKGEEPDAIAAKMYDMYAYWSIYVRAKNKSKAKLEHLPPILAILTDPSIPVDLFQEEYSEGFFRIVIYQNYPSSKIADTINAVLASAYLLADNWRIGGLGCLATGKYRHVTGFWSKQKPSPKPPAIDSIMFEIGRGLVRGVSIDGGVLIDEVDWNDGREDSVKNEFRLRPPPLIEE